MTFATRSKTWYMSITFQICEHFRKIETLNNEPSLHHHIFFHRGSINMKQSLSESLIYSESNDVSETYDTYMHRTLGVHTLGE